MEKIRNPYPCRPVFLRLYLADRGRADAPPEPFHQPQEAAGILGIDDQPQSSHHILDFLAAEKLELLHQHKIKRKIRLIPLPQLKLLLPLLADTRQIVRQLLIVIV